MSDFPKHGNPSDPIRLSRIAEWIGASADRERDPGIRRVAPLAGAGPDELGLLASRAYLPALSESNAGALLVSEDLAGELPEGGPPALVVPDAHKALATILDRLHPPVKPSSGIHPTAVVSSSATIGEGVRIGPFAVIEDDVRLGDRVQIGSHAVVGSGVSIGDDSRIFPHVVLYPGTVAGRRVWIHAGARIGVDGFGYVFQDGGHRKVPQLGRCILEDDVEIGANTTLDRGSIGDTRIGKGVKIDNLVQFGHNVTIGPHSIVASQVGVAGSTRIGGGVLVGGQAGVGGHLRIGDGARLSGQAGVTRDVAEGESVTGYPARPRMEFLRSVAAQKNANELLKRVRSLERKLGHEGEGERDGG